MNCTCALQPLSSPWPCQTGRRVSPPVGTDWNDAGKVDKVSFLVLPTPRLPEWITVGLAAKVFICPRIILCYIVSTNCTLGRATGRTSLCSQWCHMPCLTLTSHQLTQINVPIHDMIYCQWQLRQAVVAMQEQDNLSCSFLSNNYVSTQPPYSLGLCAYSKYWSLQQGILFPNQKYSTYVTAYCALCEGWTLSQVWQGQ